MSTRLLAFLLSSCALVGASVSARAEVQSGGASTTTNASGSTVTVTATAPGSSGSVGASASGGGGAVVCTWLPFSPQQQEIFNENANSGELLSITDASNLPPRGVTPPPPGVWGMVSCPPLPPYLTWVPTGAPAPATPSPAQLARSALATLHLDAPQVGTAPPTNKLVVNLATYLWVEPGVWRTLRATASVGSVSATVVATPSKVVWTMGDGNTVTCTGPGTPYNPNADPSTQSTNCSYAYPAPSTKQPNGAYDLTARVYWHVIWTSSGVAGDGDLGEIAGDPSTTAVEVDVIRSVNS